MPSQIIMRVSGVLLTATLAVDHADHGGPVQKVYCYLCFPALKDEDENIQKIVEILKEACLRLHHLEQFWIFDRHEGVTTGNPEIDVPMEDIQRVGRHLKISKTALKIFPAR
ncbi:MAG: hypothetical protein ABIZ81_01410 [Opitutaceae bacterium]